MRFVDSGLATFFKRSRVAVAAVLFTSSWASLSSAQPVVTSIDPPTQRVGELITIRGTNFGSFVPGTSQISFTDGTNTWNAGHPKVWRNTFIQVAVPAGDLISGSATPIPTTPLNMIIGGTAGISGPNAFQVMTAPGMPNFVEKTSIVASNDVSQFLGIPNLNLARTKDAHFADVDGDGWVDVIDNNSNNVSNVTNPVLRLNLNGRRFSACAMEPRNAADIGTFKTTVTAGNYIENAVTYDGDFVDLNNDNFPELIQTAANLPSNLEVRVLQNNGGAGPGTFFENSGGWFGAAPNHPGSPDDICCADINFDGFLDVVIGGRFSPSGTVWINGGGTSFSSSLLLTQTGSIHDVFFMDANNDGFPDVVLVNESGNSHIYLHNGNIAAPAYAFSQSVAGSSGFTGIAGDFNADGVMDFATGIFGTITVFLNNPAAPNNFTSTILPGGSSATYDLEIGDFDLDGDIDLVSAAITTIGNNTTRVWLNNGSGTFTELTGGVASTVFPGIANFQRLSADLWDFDKDGDLDLYLTGADGAGVSGFGDAPNQFWENLHIDTLSLEADAAAYINPATQNFIVGQGAPGTAGAMALTAINATPLANPLIFFFLVLDPNGEATFPLAVTPAFAGLSLDFVAFGFLQSGPLAATNTIRTFYF